MGAATAKIKDSWRYLNTILSIPGLHACLDGGLKQLHASNIAKQGWWDRPQECFLYDRAAELLSSSSKTQRLLEALLDRPVHTTRLRFYNDKQDFQELGVEHHSKVVVAVYEPALAFVLFLILHSEFSRLGLDPDRHIGYIRGSSDTSSIVRRFQLDPDPANTKSPIPPSLDLIIITTRVGGIGLTLNKARAMYAFDVDPSPAREKQTPCRIYRIGQLNETSHTQYITRDHGIDENSLRLRQAGQVVLHRLLRTPARQNDNEGVGIVEEGGDAFE